MKRALTVMFFLLTFQLVIGQVAIINDPDGWTNVREAPDGKSEVIHRIYENEVFWYDPELSEIQQDWIPIYIPKNKFSFGNSMSNVINGFIHKSRILPLDSLKSYSGNDFSFEYEIVDFDSTNRIIDKQDEIWVTFIDGRPVHGTDGNLPKTQVKNIEVKINSKSIKVHQLFYSDIFECDNTFDTFKIGDTYFVYQSNSDGAGGYEIVWVFTKDGLIQRLVGSMI
ncbi:hypothetical protein [Robertkochia solimangrovi]|uniref:hypothetical protein n=1 Tax=Robertkochia solimangrovi TaxID=2213046 RepID=UPI0011809A17|nr:hypothetical protein [Robertkochia solimangrovi]TRZ45119.1 hypothetical protein DMZ48_05035 [Robertkochia solimangrovi]